MSTDRCGPKKKKATTTTTKGNLQRSYKYETVRKPLLRAGNHRVYSSHELTPPQSHLNLK